MARTLKRREGLGAGVRRVYLRGLDDALRLLRDRRVGPAEKVHELRKAFKNLRALLRFLEADIGPKIRRREEQRLRTLGRRLAAARDATVRVSAVAKVRKAAGKRPRSLSTLKRRLAARRDRALRELTRADFESIGRELRRLRRDARTWEIGGKDLACIRSGLKKAYRDGRQNAAKAYTRNSDEAFHEWRKTAKTLRYQVDVLEPVWTPSVRVLRRSLHDLTDFLGDDHDLADLRTVLAGGSVVSKGIPRLTEVLGALDRRRKKLQSEARPLGERIYAEKPGAFARRMASYWTVWQARGSA